MSISEAANIRDVTKDIFSATIGSICCCYVGQPLDTVKVRMQTSPQLYPNILVTAKKTISEEGAGALWKGAVPTATGMAMENAMAFGVNEFLKRAFPDPDASQDDNIIDRPPSLWRPFAMGTITGCCSALVLLPSEIIKAKTQVMVGTGASSNDVVKKMFQKQGIKVR